MRSSRISRPNSFDPGDGRCWRAALVLALLSACRPGETPRTMPDARPVPGRTSPVVRIGILVDTTEVVVAARTPIDLTTPETGTAVPSADGSPWTIRLDGEARLEARSGSRSLRSRGPIRLQARDGVIQIDGRPYRGEALVLVGRGGLAAVNVTDLEDYLLGVVPREIGRRPAAELDAVKAQAVAARTYAVGHLGSRAGLGFDFFASVQDQVYGGISDEDTVATRAVRETRGEIVTYDGVPILAYYSSTCGGTTAAIEESWPWRAPLPYLRSESDRVAGTDRYYCDGSNRFRWTASWTRAQLLDVLGRSLRAHTRADVSVRRVDEVRLDPSGADRSTLTLTADGRSYRLRADSIRWVLRTPTGAGLNSSRIDDLAADRDRGGVTALTIRGGGWGHAVGMCQVGAMGRARSGQSYGEILRAYYRGTRIERVY